MKKFAVKYKTEFVGAVLGALAGWCYWYFVGCTSGQCLISSRPVNSTLYGALLGGIVGSLFGKSK